MRAKLWRNLKDDRTELRELERTITSTRDERLAALREVCERRRQDVQRGCASAREDIRSRAREDKQTTRRARAQAADDYAAAKAEELSPRELEKSGYRYSRGENDSLAKLALDEEYHQVFDIMAASGSLPYAWEPDDRLVKFWELYDENEANWDAFRWSQQERGLSDEELEASELASFLERGGTLAEWQGQEEVPF